MAAAIELRPDCIRQTIGLIVIEVCLRRCGPPTDIGMRCPNQCYRQARKVRFRQGGLRIFVQQLIEGCSLNNLTRDVKCLI